MRRILPCLAIKVVLVGAAYQLRSQGRLWWCACDYLLLWSGDPWSSGNSQHLLYGFVFCGLLALTVSRLTAVWQLCVAVSIEALWEVVENSQFVIQRYREETAALGYQGDTIVNSLADILLCEVEFALARRLGLRRTVTLFGVTEVALTVWIRDNLSLNVLMLMYPIDAVKEWQAAGH